MLPSIFIDSPNNIDFYFYFNDLGLRLVKLTLNQDDSTSYHLYFGDKTSRLGTILTFFHWQEISSGCRGTCLIYLENRYIVQDQLIQYYQKSKEIVFYDYCRMFDQI